MSLTYEVSDVIGVRIVNNQKEYLIVWANSWEKEANIAKDLIRKFNKDNNLADTEPQDTDVETDIEIDVIDTDDNDSEYKADIKPKKGSKPKNKTSKAKTVAKVDNKKEVNKKQDNEEEDNNKEDNNKEDNNKEDNETEKTFVSLKEESDPKDVSLDSTESSEYQNAVEVVEEDIKEKKDIIEEKGAKEEKDIKEEKGAKKGKDMKEKETEPKKKRFVPPLKRKDVETKDEKKEEIEKRKRH